MRLLLLGSAVAWSLMPEKGLAQDTRHVERPIFSGLYFGPEIGLHEHHFYIRETDLRTGSSEGRYYRAWGLGGGAFVGYDQPIGEKLRLGAEASISVGGDSPEAAFNDGSFYRARPRYGLKLTGRLGYIVGDRVLLYGTLGYGGHRYRVRASADFADPKTSGESFTVGFGAEYRLNDQASLRLDLRHLDNQMNQVLFGLPVRF